MPEILVPGEAAQELQRAQYGIAGFYCPKAVLRGGKKIARKVIAGADRQILEELGRAPRAFEMTVVLAAMDGLTYRQVRNRFLGELEKSGPRRLIHPWYGPVQNCVAMPGWQLTEEIKSSGVAQMRVTFEQDGGVSQDQIAATGDKVAEVLSANSVLQERVNERLTDSYTPSTSQGGNFADAMESQQTLANTLQDAVAKVSIPKEKLDALNATLQEYEQDRASNLQSDGGVADSFTTMMALVNRAFGENEITPGESALIELTEVITGTGDSVRDTQALFASLAGFTSNATPQVKLDTYSRQQRQANREVFDSSVRAAALGYQYENAVQADYETVPDVNAAVNALEEEWVDLRDDLDGETRSRLGKVREEALGVFANATLTLRDVTTVTVTPVSARALAYRYYEDSHLGEQIAELNETLDDPYLDGTVTILTTGTGALSGHVS